MRWLAWIVSAFAYLVARGILTEGYWGGDGLVGYGVAAVLLFCVVFVHELGHAVAAHRVGAEVRAIMVFPFQCDLRPKRRFGMARVRHDGDVGGYVSYRLDRIDAARRHILIAAAGPAANLASAAIALTAVSFATDPRWSASATLIAAFGTLSLGLTVANLIPFAGSDGMHILRLLRWKSARR